MGKSGQAIAACALEMPLCNIQCQCSEAHQRAVSLAGENEAAERNLCTLSVPRAEPEWSAMRYCLAGTYWFVWEFRVRVHNGGVCAAPGHLCSRWTRCACVVLCASHSVQHIGRIALWCYCCVHLPAVCFAHLHAGGIVAACWSCFAVPFLVSKSCCAVPFMPCTLHSTALKSC